MYYPCYVPSASTLIFIAEPPEEKDYFGGSINVFVCGALQNPEKMVPILGRPAAFAPAVALGFRCSREIIDGRNIPFMYPDEDAQKALMGIVWLDLLTDELAHIRAIEMQDQLREEIIVEVLVGDHYVKSISFIKYRRL